MKKQTFFIISIILVILTSFLFSFTNGLMAGPYFVKDIPSSMADNGIEIEFSRFLFLLPLIINLINIKKYPIWKYIINNIVIIVQLILLLSPIVDGCSYFKTIIYDHNYVLAGYLFAFCLFIFFTHYLFFINIKSLENIQLFSSEENFIQIKLDRSSVCMGDDTTSHVKEIKVKSKIKIKDFINKLQKEYIPNISNTKAVWLLIVNDKNIFLFNQYGNSYILLNKNMIPIKCNKCKIFLKYFAQKEIKEIYENLKEENT